MYNAIKFIKMKKIIFILLFAIYSIAVLAQQPTISNNSVRVRLPMGAQELSRELALDHLVNRLHGDKADSIATGYGTSKNHYKVGDILIQVKAPDTTYSFTESQVLKMKKTQDAFAEYNKTYISDIRKEKGFSALVVNFVGSAHIEIYSFYCVNDANNKVVSGRLSFKPSDKAAATKTLNDLLAGINFKE
jgi:hypothetical protein